MGPRPLVLCYHAVSDGWRDPLAVPPDTIERQLRMLLRRGLAPIPAGEVLRNPRRSFHVTFDDAYLSIEAALGAMERLGVFATVFACSGYAREGRPLEVPELRSRRAADPDGLTTMSWDRLRELARRGVEIGSHTVSHPHLTRLSDAEIVAELVTSREEIEAEIRRPCRFLAYPYGDDDRRVHAAAGRAGYAAAFTLRGSPWARAPLALPRVDVYRGDGALRFAVKTSPIGPAALGLLGALRTQASDRTAGRMSREASARLSAMRPRWWRP